MVDEVNAKSGQVVLIPVCDGDCVTSGGSNAVYHVIRVAAFYLDYMSDQNSGNNTACQGNGTTLDHDRAATAARAASPAGSSATSRPDPSGPDRSRGPAPSASSS